MAGMLEESKKSPDVLFDLTPEDDKTLQESDLLQLINYGQVQKSVEVTGADGSNYEIDMALLWDEDYIDILKKTIQYANDAVLRVQLLDRLKLHKAIQRINKHDYSNKADPVAQRQLWTILCRLSDLQMGILKGKYKQIEIERNLSVPKAIMELNKKADETATLLKKASPNLESTQQVEELKVQEHEAMVKEVVDAPNELIKGVVAAVEKKVMEPVEGKPVVQSPKQI